MAFFFLINKIRSAESTLIQNVSSFAQLKSLLRHTYSLTSHKQDHINFVFPKLVLDEPKVSINPSKFYF